MTHAVDMNQRVIPLAMTGIGDGTRTFRSPPNQNIALPGYYMLFVLNDDGVPSVAKWVRLRAGATENPVTGPGGTTRSPVTPVTTTPPARQGVLGQTITPPASKKHRAKKKPTVRVTLVRRNGVRMVRVALTKSDYRRAKLSVRLRNHRGRTVSSTTRTLETGHTTILGRPKVTSSVRSVAATVVSASG